jgi:hypothetical protein
MENNEKLYQEAQEAILKLFSDTSVSQDECRNNLNALLDYIEDMLSSLDLIEVLFYWSIKVNKQIFVVGKIDLEDYLKWELIGAFENKKDALKICRTKYHFISPIEINKDFGDEPMKNMEAYYPLLD